MIKKFGKWISRPLGESPVESHKVTRLKSLLGLLFLSTFVAVIVLFFSYQINQWKTVKLAVRVPPSQWKVLFENPHPDQGAPSAEDVLASPFSREDIEHTDRIRKQRDKPFWVAARLNASQLKTAQESQAVILSLGSGNSGYRLWVDGDLKGYGINSGTHALQLAIPLSRLASNSPLDVEVEFRNFRGWVYPDLLDTFLGGVGFLTQEAAELENQKSEFFLGGLPIALLLFYFIFTFVFLSLWNTSPNKQEYFVMFLFCLLQVEINFRQLLALFPSLFYYYSASASHGFDLAEVYMEGALGAILGMSFSRVRRFFMGVVSFLLIGSGLFLTFLLRGSTESLKGSAIVGTYITPLMLLFGACICWVQAYVLSVPKLERSISCSKRIRRLSLFGAGLIVIAVTYVGESRYFASSTHYEFWFRTVEITVICFLMGLVAADYRESELDAERTKIGAQVAHDIRSPIAVLGVAVRTLKESDEETRFMIQSAIERIGSIANNLLSKTPQGLTNLKTVSVTTTALLSLLRSVISEKKIEFRNKTEVIFELHEKGLMPNLKFRASLELLSRILSNLVNNAVEAIDGPGKVILSANLKEKSILITVSDSGRGIHADLISTLGELGQTYGKKGGSGLGLYHARTTAEAWGGTLLIQSSRAGGTSITLDLPLYSTEQKKFEALASG